MVSEVNSQSDKLSLHYVDGDFSARAQFAKVACDLGIHCELYDSLTELSAYPPRHGLIVLRDTLNGGGDVASAFAEMHRAGIWLAAIVVGQAPAPVQIVDAIKAGALDYLDLPVDAGRLQRCLARTTHEAVRISSLRRRSIEARQLINGLSTRETQVLELLAAGHSNKLIARELGISPRTVEIHRANMMNKLGATHSAKAVRIKLDAEQMLVA